MWGSGKSGLVVYFFWVIFVFFVKGEGGIGLGIFDVFRC